MCTEVHWSWIWRLHEFSYPFQTGVQSLSNGDFYVWCGQMGKNWKPFHQLKIETLCWKKKLKKNFLGWGMRYITGSKMPRKMLGLYFEPTKAKINDVF